MKFITVLKYHQVMSLPLMKGWRKCFTRAAALLLTSGVRIVDVGEILLQDTVIFLCLLSREIIQ
jgi:hypothetical protein